MNLNYQEELNSGYHTNSLLGKIFLINSKKLNNNALSTDKKPNFILVI